MFKMNNSYNWYQNLCLDIQNLLCLISIDIKMSCVLNWCLKILFKVKYKSFDLNFLYARRA